MAPERVERRLAAILATDVVGYSRLMEADEAGTLARLKDHRQDLIESTVSQYGGRVVKLMGDGMLVEFPSVVGAVQCAIDVQRGMEDRNSGVPEEQRIQFRVGVNLGDVIIEGDDIYGEGVNVAARLEALAEPGGICISDVVHQSLGAKLDLGFEDLGQQQVKNIEKPVRVYRVLLEPEAAGTIVSEKQGKPKAWRLGTIATAAVAALALAIAAGLWWRTWAPEVEPASEASVAEPLPNKPSIAVLPFVNMSSNPEQEYFVDGLTDDLITRISKISGLDVVSRTTAFTYKDKDMPIEEIARELGVDYVLEGSVRRAEGHVRINAQLIDGTTGGHLWAGTFDRPYKDIFALQDEVQGLMVAALEVELSDEERRETTRWPTDNVEAFDYYLKAERARLAYSWAEFGINDAFTFYDKALALDPDFVDAHIGNARAGMNVWRFSTQVLSSTLRARDRAQSALAAALALDPDNAEALVLQARMQLYLLNHELALSLVRGAVLRHPKGPEARVTLAFVLMASEQPDEAREAYASALALASKPSPELLLDAGEGYLLLGEAEKAAALLERARDGGASGLVTAPNLAAAYARLGDMEKARAELESVRRVWPWVSVAWYRVALAHVRNGQRVARNFLAPLLKAGMSEWPYGFVGRPEDRLHDADLKVLFRGSPREEISGGYAGITFSYLHDGDGNWRAVAPGIHSIVHFSGANVIKGDMLCPRSEAVQMGREYCNAVYRNPDGSPETKDEYLRVDLSGLWRFSIKPLERD